MHSLIGGNVVWGHTIWFYYSGPRFVRSNCVSTTKCFTCYTGV